MQKQGKSNKSWMLKGLVYWKEQELHCTGGSSVPCALDRNIQNTTFSLVDSEIIFNIYISISWIWWRFKGHKLALEYMRLKHVIPRTFNINLNFQDIPDETDPSRHAAIMVLMLRLYNLFQQSFSNCFSRNKLQMLTWARRLETRVVQSLHGCQFLEMGSIDKRRSVDNCPGHVTRDTWLWPCPAQHSGAAARVPQVPGPCRLPLQERAGGILGQWPCKQWTVEIQWQWQWLVLYNDKDNDHDHDTMTHCWTQLTVPTV